MASIAIRLDAGPSIGSGHLIRCTALAEELRKYGHKVCFLCRNRLSQSIDFPVYYFDRTYSMQECAQYSFPPITDELPALSLILKSEQIGCIIVDHYGATEEYFHALVGMGIAVVAVDDMCVHKFPVDVVINGNIYAEDLFYEGATHALLGPEYLLLRKEFQNVPPKKINTKVSKIYITSGGADPLHFCEAMMQCLVSLDMKTVQMHLIVGPDFEEGYVHQLKTSFPHTLFIFHADMRQCMEDADLFITAAGSTLYELAACGTPNISYILAEDQRRIGNAMHHYNYTCCLGRFKDIDQENIRFSFTMILNNFTYRKTMSEQAQCLFSGTGAEHTACFLHHMLINRKAGSYENTVFN